jgi:putative ABC transport system ATP-binding protein
VAPADERRRSRRIVNDQRVIIRVSDITKSYRLGDETVHALDGVSVDVHEGEFVAIMGASGSGKSTLMNILGCLDRPTSGTYELDGVDVASRTDDELSLLRSEKIGFVFQNYNLLPRMRSVDQVAVPLIYQRATGREARAIAALQRVGLGQRLWHRPTEMSGGQQQRVAIARALVTNPSVLFADEPTGNLDSHVSEEILALLQGLNDSGVTIMMVTHEADVAQCAKRIVTVGDGKVIGDEPVRERHIARRLDVIEAAPAVEADAPPSGAPALQGSA